MISTALNWTYAMIATWYGAAIIGGLLILIFERWDKKRERYEADVHQVAERYRQWYGEEAITKIGDHMLAASLASDGRYRRFLERVLRKLEVKANGPK